MNGINRVKREDKREEPIQYSGKIIQGEFAI